MKRIAVLGVVLTVLGMSAVVFAATEAEIQAAIDAGLAWLASQQCLVPGPDYGRIGVNRPVGETGLAVKKFEHDAILRGFDDPFDPDYMYHEVVERGLAYLFSHAQTYAIGVQPNGDPDTDGDGIGVAFFNRRTYETGIALMAIVESNNPDCVVNAPGSPVDGWTYYDVAVDILDWLCFGQIDAGTWRGSWGYDENAGNGDQSNSGYATLGLGFAEQPAPHGFGLTIPPFVKNEMNFWINYIQINVPGSQFDGGSAYYRNSDTLAGYQTVNILETGNLIFEMALHGDPPASPRLHKAIDYIVRHWTDGGYSWPDPQGWHGNYQAMFTMMKGLEAYGIEEIGGFDWFDEVSDTIVVNQVASGAWPPDVWDNWIGGDSVLATSWALLTLQKAAPEIIIPVSLDIKPTSCPNPLNVKSKGVLPVAILGTDVFDVTMVNPDSVWLEGVAPLRYDYEDVATPFEGELCDCHELGPDGYLDMTLKFDRQAIVAALGETSDGEVRVLTLTGKTYDDLPILGQDCVWILDKTTPPPPKIPKRPIGGGGGAVWFTLDERAQVSVVVYDVSGRRVKNLVSEVMDKGQHTVEWDGRDDANNRVANGIYFCHVKAGSLNETIKMVHTK